MKTLLLFLTGLCLALSPLSARGSVESSDSGETGKLIIVGGTWHRDTMVGDSGDLIEAFENKTGREVEFQAAGGSQELLQQMYRVGVGNSIQEDIVFVLHSSTVEEAVNLLEPLNPYLAANPLDGYPDDYSAGMLEAFSRDGNLYSIPIRAGAWPMWYNQRILGELGFSEPPKTVQEMYDVMKSATYTTSSGEKVFGLITRGRRYDLHQIFAIFARMFGGDLITEDLKVVVNEEPAVQAMEFIKKIYSEGLIPQNWSGMGSDTVKTYFMEGRAALQLGNLQTSEVNDPEKSKEAGNLVPGHVPLLAELQTPQKTFSDSISFAWGISIFKAADNKDLAWEFIRQSGTLDARMIMARNQNTPARISVLETQGDFDQQAVVFAEMFPHTRPAIPAVNNANEVIDLIGMYMENVVFRGMDVQEQMDILSEKIEALL